MDRLLPNGKPPDPHLLGMKCKFTKEEDMILKALVESSNGKVSWKEISKKIGSRTPRQCRERYKNYLSNQINHGEWTPSEDQTILTKYYEMGKVWNNIAKFLPGRTGNAVRNRWKYLLSKKNQNGSDPNLKQPQQPIATLALPKDGAEPSLLMNKSRSSSDDDTIGPIFKKMFKIQKNAPLYDNEEVNELISM